MSKTTFALFFGNRGFFPETLIAGARKEMEARLQQLGYDTLLMPADATPHGAVEAAAEGEKYATWLATKRGHFDGVLMMIGRCPPVFRAGWIRSDYQSAAEPPRDFLA